jgi:two-component system, LytTR family, sensor kinase
MNQTPQISKDFDLEGIDSLKVTTLSGDIELVGFDENCFKIDVFFSVRGFDSLFFQRHELTFVDDERFVLNFNKELKKLEVYAKPNYWNPYNWANFLKISFRIYVPAKIRSSITTWGGDVSIRNVSGEHEFKTWGGDILIDNVKGKLKGNTWGGKIEVLNSDAIIETKTWGGKVILNDNKGEINARTYGGNILIKNQKGLLIANTSGGNIVCNGLNGELKCATSGGKIKLFKINGNVGASTLGGNIEVEVESIKEYLWLDSSGGRLDALLPLNQGLDFNISANKVRIPNLNNFEGYHTRSELTGKLNGGGANVKIKVNGKVNINPLIQTQTLKPESSEIKIEKIEQKKQPISNKIKEKSSNFHLNSIIIGLLFCSILCYGLSSITYFSLELFNPLDKLAPIYKGVFLSNIGNGLAAFFAVNLFVKVFEHRVYQTWLKYLLLIVVTFGFVSFFQIYVGIWYWSTLDEAILNTRTNNLGTNAYGMIYGVLPHFVSCAYYYYWIRNRQITRKISEQEYQLLNLEKLKTKSDLTALQARINPHFLYNSLNSIASLVHSDPDKAEEMTILLSKLFRYTTDRNNEDFNSIKEELEIVKAYLSVEQVRFGDRLKFSIELEKSLEEFQIPRLLLQPIVENAIKHGISKSSDEGKIEIKINQIEDKVYLTVHDSGQLFPTEMTSGYGLRSIQEKLRLIYGEDASLEIQNNLDYKAVIITIKSK